MCFVYILKSERKKLFYTGCTNNLKRRIQEHNAGSTQSTKHMRPLKLVYCEEFSDKKTARERELYLKSGVGRQERDKLLNDIYAG